MVAKQCARMLSDNVQCDGLVASSLTGDLCTKCYFELKRKSDSPNQDTPDLTKEIKSDENYDRIQESENEKGQLQNETINSQDSNDTTETIKEYEIEKEHHPSKDSDKVETEIKKDPNKKYCQSCIERGYGLKLATREWTKDYYICDECFEPLLNSLVSHDTTRAEIEQVKNLPKVDSPFIQQFYSLLNIPPHLQYVKSDDVLRHRNEIFNYHAPALVNMSLDQIKEQIENYQIMLFQIKVGLEPLTDYINKIKHEERTKANIEGIKKSKTEVSKGTSKVKISKEEKEAKALGLTLEKYQEMVKKAKVREFEKITGQSIS
jgi:hypothetical protein